MATQADVADTTVMLGTLFKMRNKVNKLEAVKPTLSMLRSLSGDSNSRTSTSASPPNGGEAAAYT